MQVVLTDNGNAATTVVFYWGDNDGGTTASNWDSNVTLTNAPEGTNLRASLTGLPVGRLIISVPGQPTRPTRGTTGQTAPPLLPP